MVHSGSPDHWQQTSPPLSALSAPLTATTPQPLLSQSTLGDRTLLQHHGHPMGLGASLQASMHRVPRSQSTTDSLPPKWPSPGAELLPICPRKDTDCGEGAGGGVWCWGLTCETPESPLGWTWSPPGSDVGPAHSALSSSSGTRGLWRDKVKALDGWMEHPPACGYDQQPWLCPSGRNRASLAPGWICTTLECHSQACRKDELAETK